jgi:hypothetical protein
MIEPSLHKLLAYVEAEDFNGYDPYDTLNSWVPFHWLGKWGPVLAIQLQKRNPINIRPLLGIKKGRNPKAIGLFLRAYSMLYRQDPRPEYLQKMHELFDWLKANPSKGYSKYCWGYNFPWASSVKYLEAYVPSAVVTGFVVKGIYEYYQAIKPNRSNEIIEVMAGAADFVLHHLDRHEDESGVCISYTPVMKDACYNASLLGAEILARYLAASDEQEQPVMSSRPAQHPVMPSSPMQYTVIPSSPAQRDVSRHPESTAQSLDTRRPSGSATRDDVRHLIESTVDFVVARQLHDGRWNYSIDLESGKERTQIDFHQGYVIESIDEIMQLIGLRKPHWEGSIRKGLEYYRKKQFYNDGRSLWRIPKEWPVEIHNQAQGIITFSKYPEYMEFAKVIAQWTFSQMQRKNGSFDYRIYRTHSISIPYMRWSNAWMAVSGVAVLIDPSMRTSIW